MKKEFEVVYKEIELPLNKLKGKTILVTGALGMLSSYLIEFISFLNDEYEFNTKLVLLARDKKRLISKYPIDRYNVEYIVSDISHEMKFDGNLDFILHLAGNSSPYHIKNNPIDIIKTNVLGSLNVVELAKNTGATKVLFSSTREVYGNVEQENNTIFEENFGSFNPLDARSCYPESKRMGENIFKSASVQYGIKFNVVRIAHSYGPGMFVSDGRVMADFIGNAINGEDIALLSDGEAVRSFCYVADAITAMLLVLCEGDSGEAYNIANEKEEIKVFELAKKVASFSENINVTRIEPKEPSVYCAYERTALSTQKVEGLGWKPLFNLDYGLKSTFEHLTGSIVNDGN
ncbi:NAD-dependent epimerase/dehydratase family protein [Vibrio splendidus]